MVFIAENGKGNQLPFRSLPRGKSLFVAENGKRNQLPFPSLPRSKSLSVVNSETIVKKIIPPKQRG